MKLDMNRSQLPAVDEFVARNYDGSNNVEHYQAWLAKQSLAGKSRNLYDTAFDALREKSDALLQRIGVDRSTTKDEDANNAKYGDLPPDGHRDLKLTLAGMSPTDRLTLVRQLERLGKTPMLNEASLQDLHERLVEATKTWKSDLPPTLLTATEEAAARVKATQADLESVGRQRKSVSGDESKELDLALAEKAQEEAVKNWQQARDAYQKEMNTRAQKVGDAINPWLLKNDISALKVEAGAWDGVANYSYGQGRISISNAALSKPEFSADFFGMLFHETVHAKQDVLRIKWLADQMGINEKATAEQLEQLNRRQVMPTVLHGDGQAQLEDALPFTEQILAARKGARLSPAEARQGAAIDAQIRAGQPAWTTKAEAITDQQVNVLNVVDFNEPYRVGNVLDELVSNPESVQQKFGFTEIPARLSQLSAARAALSPDVWSRGEPDASVVNEVKDILNEQLQVLANAYKPYADKKYEHYVGSVMEGQAYPAGLLAYLFARSQASKH
jgi:hypothetical protein